MKTICTKCKSEKVYIEQPEQTKVREFMTLDDLANERTGVVPAVYKVTTWRCGDCGYTVSY